MTSINFACKQFSIDEVIKCGFGLTRSDYEIMKYLMEIAKDSNEDEGWQTAEDISKKFNFNLSTAQRAVKRLYEKGVVARRQSNLSGGGYTFFYKGYPKSYMKRKIMDVVHAWVKRVDDGFNQWT